MTEQNKRTVVVTGGSRGIGRAICIYFALPGTYIYFNYFNPSDPDAEMAAANETERLVADAQGTVVSKSVNIVVKKEVVGFFEEVLDTTGRIDVLVNNAGITKDGLLVRMKENDWDAVGEEILCQVLLGSQGISSMDEYNPHPNVMQVQGLGHRTITTSHHEDLFTCEERAITCATVADAVTGQSGLPRYIEVSVGGPGREENRFRRESPPARRNREQISALDIHDFFPGKNLHILQRMIHHNVHQCFATHLRNTGPVFHNWGRCHLTA